MVSKENEKVKPIIRWVGGKTKLLPEILNRVPKNFSSYFEPFVGSGAVLLALLSDFKNLKCTVSDLNHELINFYIEIQKDFKAVLNILNKFENNKQSYYKIRSLDRNNDFNQIDPTLRAARFFYLNKTCFQGLWRVNSKNQNNTPYGKTKFNLNINNISDFSNLVSKVTFLNSDFESTLLTIDNNSFVYLDPPYIPISKTSSFTKYTLDDFDNDDQIRLLNCCIKIDKIGGKFLLSNSDCDKTREIFKNFRIETVHLKRLISANKSSRGEIQEVLIRNY